MPQHASHACHAAVCRSMPVMPTALGAGGGAAIVRQRRRWASVESVFPCPGAVNTRAGRRSDGPHPFHHRRQLWHFLLLRYWLLRLLAAIINAQAFWPTYKVACSKRELI